MADLIQSRRMAMPHINGRHALLLSYGCFHAVVFKVVSSLTPKRLYCKCLSAQFHAAFFSMNIASFIETRLEMILDVFLDTKFHIQVLSPKQKRFQAY